jgi:hypothetical protein
MPDALQMPTFNRVCGYNNDIAAGCIADADIQRVPEGKIVALDAQQLIGFFGGNFACPIQLSASSKSGKYFSSLKARMTTDISGSGIQLSCCCNPLSRLLTVFS